MKEFTCIVCPKSCKGRVEEDARTGELNFFDYTCKRGIDYARNEYTCPKRLLTTTVKISGGPWRRLPVVSDGEIEKDKLKSCFEYLRKVEARAPVSAGDPILRDILGSGINIIAAQDCAGVSQ